MRRFVLAACLLSAPARAETLLHLGETATVMAAPDELVATLRAEASLPTAAEVQARVNAMMQDALATARAVPALTVSTGGYGVWQAGPTPQDRTQRWEASETLNLTGHDEAVLLKLVGVLQEKGLVIGSLNWRLSRQAQQQAHQEATRQALAALRGRVEEAAAALDLRFEQFKDVRLDSAPPPTLFGAVVSGDAPAPLTRAAAASPPSAVAEDVAVTATAQADAILQPR